MKKFILAGLLSAIAFGVLSTSALAHRTGYFHWDWYYDWTGTGSGNSCLTTPSGRLAVDQYGIPICR